jgi:trehalose-phosphatase
LERAERQLRRRLGEIRGARLERKRFAIALHYRQLERPEEAGRVEQLVDEVVAALPALRKKGGKKIFELQPDVDWDKGRAVLWLAEHLGLDGDDVVIIYVGDDLTDEDAFRALRRRGAGIGIRVAPPGPATEADYYLRDCGEVREFLERLRGRLAGAKTVGEG